MLCESTNVERPGFSLSEKVVGKAFDNIFADAKGQRIIVATFSSNIHRLQQAINSAEKVGRKIIISGRSMQNATTLAHSLGYINIPAGMLVDINDINQYGDHEIVVITTGSQGE